MAAGGAEEHFAKKLANNEKIIRDRAVNKLRAWIRSRPKDGPGFSEVDLLKIWKGLFYCMWMSDKPLIQEELALNISQLVFSFRNEKSAVLFIKTFFKTMQREWHGIDRLRLDKFYLLIRFFVKESFNFLKKAAWEEWLVSEVSNIFHEEPMNPTSQAVPDGIRFHLVSVFVAELESVVDDKVPASVLLKLLDPLFLLAAYSKNVTVTGAVKKSLFEYLVQCGSDEADETLKTVRFKVDFSAVAHRLFTLASDRNVLGRNRNQLFSWSKRLRKQSTGQLEERVPVQEGETSNGMPAGKKRKKAEKSSCLVNGSAEENCSEKDHTREAKQKRRKRKHDGEIEKEQEKQDKDCIKEEKEKEKKRKRKNTDNVLNVGSCLGEKVTCKDDKVESKKKKKKKSLVDISNRDAISEDSNSDHNNDCKILTITNGSNKSEEQESSKSLVNDSSQSETSTVNWDTKLTITSGSNKGEEHDSHVDTRFSPEIEDQTPSRTNNRRVLHNAASSSSEPFAKFQKNSTPPAFVRKRLAKTPSTEPQQSKTSKLKNQPPGSVPPKQTSKRVRIEMSKNTSHTAQDYQRSVKESPRIPFDAHKTPTQGLLKSPPLPRRTTLVLKAAPSTDPGQGRQRKKQPKAGQRPKALDFF